MGGRGSGKWYRWDIKNTTQQCRRLDVRCLNKQRLLVPGTNCGLQWYADGEPDGDIRIQTMENQIVLRYRILRSDEEWRPVVEPVALCWTACHFGGRRPWFICPGIVNGRHCRRRVANLYLAGTYFLCRHCYGLTYQSRNETLNERMIRKGTKIRRRLGASSSQFDPIEKKPKGMHRKTFEHLIGILDDAEDRSTMVFYDTMVNRGLIESDPLIDRLRALMKVK